MHLTHSSWAGPSPAYGADQAPEGLELAVLRMNEGEQALVTVGPQVRGWLLAGWL